MALDKHQLHIREDMKRFLSNFPDPLPLSLEYFHPVQWPIVVSEAIVNIRSVQNFSVLSLLILRLFDAGITDPDAICRISGMSRETVQAYLHRETHLYEHIDPATLELTELGKETLERNTEDMEKPESCQYYRSAIRIHIEPFTASLIPQYLEWEKLGNFQPNQDAGDFVLPPNGALTDDIFLQELNQRLVSEINSQKIEFVRADSLKNGDVINDVVEICPTHIFFRWAYLAKFTGMRFPMLLLSGKISTETTNAHSKAEGFKRETVILPVNISQSDKDYLEPLGMLPKRVLSHPDISFYDLENQSFALELTLPSEEEETEGEVPV